MPITPYYHDEASGITIYHGDCRDVLPTLEPGSVDLVLTDPPYGVSERTDRASKGRSALAECNDFDAVAGDEEPFDPAPLLSFRRVALFGANHFADRLPPSPSWLIWNKVDGLPSKREIGFNDNADAELIWTNLGGPARLVSHRWMGLLKASEQDQRRVHPTQKPVAIMRWILERWSKPGDLILDPYMGSGPIAQACHEMGRRYIGCELVETYCEIAAKRLQQSVMSLMDVA